MCTLTLLTWATHHACLHVCTTARAPAPQTRALCSENELLSLAACVPALLKPNDACTRAAVVTWLPSLASALCRARFRALENTHAVDAVQASEHTDAGVHAPAPSNLALQQSNNAALHADADNTPSECHVLIAPQRAGTVASLAARYLSAARHEQQAQAQAPSVQSASVASAPAADAAGGASHAATASTSTHETGAASERSATCSAPRGMSLGVSTSNLGDDPLSSPFGAHPNQLDRALMAAIATVFPHLRAAVDDDYHQPVRTAAAQAAVATAHDLLTTALQLGRDAAPATESEEADTDASPVAALESPHDPVASVAMNAVVSAAALLFKLAPQGTHALCKALFALCHEVASHSRHRNRALLPRLLAAVAPILLSDATRMSAAGTPLAASASSCSGSDDSNGSFVPFPTFAAY
ncbi:MAG: hypothetical protein EOO41_02420, partial [Methanobacteriota archaeon]